MSLYGNVLPSLTQKLFISTIQWMRWLTSCHLKGFQTFPKSWKLFQSFSYDLYLLYKSKFCNHKGVWCLWLPKHCYLDISITLYFAKSNINWARTLEKLWKFGMMLHDSVLIEVFIMWTKSQGLGFFQNFFDIIRIRWMFYNATMTQTFEWYVLSLVSKEIDI